MNVLPAAIKNFIDAIFNAPIAFLTMVYGFLAKIAMIAGTGINLNNYFGFFSYLPAPFITVLNSILASVMLLAILQLIKYIMRVYGEVKEWLKWW
jgi:uncharacterized membrane protein